MENKTNLILEVKNLQKHFPIEKSFFGKTLSTLKAVDNVSFKLEKGKTIGVVGESGCGKTTLGRTILQLYDTTGGKSLYYGHTIYEFMPKYYIDALKKSRENIKKFNVLINYSPKDCPVSAYTYAQNKSRLDSLLKIIEKHKSGESVLDGQSLNEIEANIKVLNTYFALIDNTAPYVGGLMLCNENVGEILLEKIYIQNKLVKCDFKENSEEELKQKLEEV